MSFALQVRLLCKSALLHLHVRLVINNRFFSLNANGNNYQTTFPDNQFQSHQQTSPREQMLRK